MNNRPLTYDNIHEIKLFSYPLVEIVGITLTEIYISLCIDNSTRVRVYKWNGNAFIDQSHHSSAYKYHWRLVINDDNMVYEMFTK